MTTDSNQINTSTDSQLTEEEIKKPEETSGLHIEAFLRISEPETGRILLETRA